LNDGEEIDQGGKGLRGGILKRGEAIDPLGKKRVLRSAGKRKLL
jgi:hypothetical protein